MKTKIFYLILVFTITLVHGLFAHEGARISKIMVNDRISSEEGVGATALPACSDFSTGGILYVDQSKTSSGNGTSWSQAIESLSEAIQYANECDKVSEIRVARGTYKPSTTASAASRKLAFLIERGYKLTGGYPSGGGAYNPAENPTILDGDLGSGFRSFHVLIVYGINSFLHPVTIDGFRVRNGAADGFGVLNLGTDADPVLLGEHSGGGAAIFESVRVIFKSCAFYDNGSSNTAKGGAFYCNGSSVSLLNCVVANNMSGSYGGGVAMDGLGGAFYAINSTFYGNIGETGGASFNHLTTFMKFSNCIVWGNSSAWGGSGTRDAEYSIIQGGYAGTGNMSVDPEFSNPADLNGADNIWFTSDDGLDLKNCSPAINRGNNEAVSESEDIIGNPRIYNEIVDMGPYEYQLSQPPVSANVLAESFDIAITNVYGGETNITKDCKTIVTLTPNGVNALSGTLEATVYLQDGAPEYNGKPYVARHYDIQPYSNALTATSWITLYFKQDDFNRYNTAVGPRAPHLPESAVDDTKKRNVRINQFHSGHGDPFGILPPPLKTPEDYSGGFTLIDPKEEDITWHTGRGGSEGYWSVSFSVTGFSGFFVTAGEAGALPVTLVSISAAIENKTVELQWQTTSEVNSSHFSVQRSYDGKKFENIAQVQSAGNTSNTTAYHYSDDLSGIDRKSENFYYRLQQFDQNETYTFSRLVSVKSPFQSDEDPILLMGNPVENNATVLFGTSQCDEVSVRVLDMKGRLVLTKKFAKTCLKVFSLPTTTLPKGIYLLEVLWKQNRKTLKIVKQ